MQNQVIPNGSKVDTQYGVFEVLEYDFVRDQYFCYKKDFDGHSGTKLLCQKYLNTKYEGSCWWFGRDEVTLIEENEVNNTKQSKFKTGDKVRCVEAGQGQWIKVGGIYTVKCVRCKCIHLEEITEKHNYHESRFELVSETKLNYREMQPTDMVKVCIGDNEFEVPLGDLVAAQALIGRSTGIYGEYFYKHLLEALGDVDLSSKSGDVISFTKEQEQALDYFFQPHYDKQKQKDELSNLILAKQEELSKLIDTLNQM